MADRVSIAWFLFSLFLVVVFAWTRPMTLRDFENRRLAQNTSAQVFFVLLYALAFLILTAAYHYGGRALLKFAEQIGWVWVTQYAIKSTGGSAAYAPLLALTTLGWMQSLQVLRELERTALVYTYSARYLYTDVRDLTAYFRAHDFQPTDIERAKNVNVLERLNIVLTDTDTRKIDLKVVKLWRKVETLLRQLAIWSGETKSVLNSDERAMLADVVTAHERKTELASNIIRLLDHVASGKGAAQTLSEVSSLLTSKTHDDRSKLEAVEARLESALDAKPETAAAPVFLSSAQLQGFLSQIHLYFEAEYRILLARTSELAAKAIVYSGDRARARLEAVKDIGFTGLGRMRPISFNRILWVFFAVFAFSFALFLFRQWDLWRESFFGTGAVKGWTASQLTQQNLMMVGMIATTIASATIVGAVVGSTRRFAQSPSTPWRAYIAAGLVAVCLFFLTSNVRDMLFSGVDRPMASLTQQTPEPSAAPAPNTTPGEQAERHRPPPAARAPTFRQMAPWALMPFFMTIGICLLARLSRWPVPSFGAGPTVRAIIDRTLDGFALAGIMIAAQILILRVLFPLFGAPPPARLALALQQEWLPVSVLWLPLMMGLFIGALVIREVRLAAHSRLVLEPEAEPKAATAVPPFAVKMAT